MDSLTMALIIGIDAVIFLAIGIMFWLDSRKDRTYLVEKISDSDYRLIKTIKTNANETKVSYNGKSYPLIKNAGYLDKGKTIRHIDIQTGNYLHWTSSKSVPILSPSEFDNIISGHYLKEVLHAIRPSTLTGLLMIILPVICLAVGFVVGWFLATQQPIKVVIENITPIVPVP